MDSFAGRIAVVTGGGTGMGRELVCQLAAEGASVATCDLNPDTLAETARLAGEAAPAGTRITTHACDVADEADVLAFRDAVVADHDTDHVDLVFNNAGIGGGGSFVMSPREEWERTFGVCWSGVYLMSRAFVPLLIASDEAMLINTSSVNGFWAALGPGMAHTAYSTAKFAVKGFSEALLEDFRINAPHVKVAVVMPGHIGTDIVTNSQRIHRGVEPAAMTDDQLSQERAELVRQGLPIGELGDEEFRQVLETMGAMFRESAPMTAAEAVTVILDGVHAGRWRILVGDDAVALDEAVRADPENIYGPGGLGLAALRSNA